MICWFDDVLLILIHGFAWFRVDLAFPQVYPSFIHEISSILTPKSPFSAQDRAPDLGFRVDPDPLDDRCFTDIRSPRNHLTSATYRTSGTPLQNEISGFPSSPDVRPPDIRPSPDVRYLYISTSADSCFIHNLFIRSPILTFFSLF